MEAAAEKTRLLMLAAFSLLPFVYCFLLLLFCILFLLGRRPFFFSCFYLCIGVISGGETVALALLRDGPSIIFAPVQLDRYSYVWPVCSRVFIGERRMNRINRAIGFIFGNVSTKQACPYTETCSSRVSFFFYY